MPIIHSIGESREAVNEMARLRMGVIGVGHLGKEHARILAGMADVELVGVADVNLAQAEAVALRCDTQAYESYQPLLDRVDAVTIVVPTTHHCRVASEFLRRGVSVFVEKPLALSVAEADELVALARSRHVALQVGHIERFNPAFEDLQQRSLQPKYIACERHGPFSGRSTDIGVILDLMIHDLDLVLQLVGSPVVAVDALGVALFGEHEDVAQARLTFANGCVANLSASRASMTPVRRMQAWGPEGFASVDFAKRRLSLVQPTEALRRHGLGAHRLDPAARAQLKDVIFGQHLQTLDLDLADTGDQLSAELRHFTECVHTGAVPRVSAEDGRDALALAFRILDAVRAHAWEAGADAATGPRNLPAPRGALFTPLEFRAVA